MVMNLGYIKRLLFEV